MKKIRHYLRFTLLMAMLLAIASPALADDGDEYDDIREFDIGDLHYTVYIKGEKADAVAIRADCQCYDSNIATAYIPSSITAKYEWWEWSDQENDEIKRTRHLTAPVTLVHFGRCSSLTRVSVPNSVTNFLFVDCPKLKSVNIPNSATYIGYGAFSGCSSLTSVTIPNSVIYIDTHAFYKCSSLKSITIPNSVTAIDRRAFEGCSSLTKVTIGNSVTHIGECAFEGCPSVREVYSTITNPEQVWLGVLVFYGIPKKSCVLYVPPGTEDLYRNADQWKDFFIMGSYEMKTAYSKGFANSFSSSVKPKGVTADGESRMYIYFDEDISSVKSVTKKIKIDGEEVTDPAIIGYFGEFKKLPNGKFGFDYRAPEDFPGDYSDRNMYEISLNVNVLNNSNKEWDGHKTITVMRPGVLLLHGFWGNNGAFEAQYRHLLTEGGYQSFQVLNANYEESNTASFQENVQVVDDFIMQLFNKLAKTGIISSKYDLVGHSMGGILSRLYAQDVNAVAVNRIITLDTPHHGSELANFREPVLDYLDNRSASLDVVGVACKLLHRELSGPEYGAVNDLKPSSDAISWVNSKSCEGIPIHAIGSYMTSPSTWVRSKCSVSLIWPHLVDLVAIVFPEYSELLERNDWGFSFMDEIYRGQNDGIVSLASQLGGLSFPGANMQVDMCSGYFGYNSNAHHMKTHHWAQTVEYITESLHLPKNSNRFSMTGFRAPVNTFLESGGPSLVSVPEFKDAPETSFINLTLEKNEDDYYDYFDEDEYNRDLVATVTTSDDIVSFLVFACLDDDKCLVSVCDTEPTFVIPDNYEGNLVFYALGRTANDELVADIDSVEYSSITSLAALDFEDYDDLMMCVGQTLGLNVIATWGNGESEYVKPTYSATPDGILSIDGQMFTPVAVGECELIAEYKGLTCTKKITVYPGSKPVTSRYDVNLDGEVNIADVNAVISLILLPEGGTLGDVNGDGEVNIADINAIIDEILSN